MGLTLKVLVPTLIGQLLRPWLKSKIVVFKPFISIFSQCLVLLIILNAVSSSTHRILEAGPTLFLLFLFMIVLHLFIIVINKTTASLIGLDLPSMAAFTIHVSQKTLTISYLVWAGYFATAYPMALIPAIAYHLTQMIMDTFVAQWFRRRVEVAPLKGAGISNIEYRLHEFRRGHPLIEKEGAQRFITSIFNIPCSTFDILLMNRHRISRTFQGYPP